MPIKPVLDKYVGQLPERKVKIFTVVVNLMSFQVWSLIDGILLGSDLGLESAQALSTLVGQEFHIQTLIFWT